MKRTGFISFFVLAFAIAAQGAKVNMNAAKTAAANWAYLQGRASSGVNKGFCASYGTSVTNIFETKVTTNVSYYVANLSQGGTVILSGDTEMEPVIGFSSGVVTNVSAGGCNVLKGLLERDMKLRLHQKEEAEKSAAAVVVAASGAGSVSSGTGMVAASGAGSAAGVTVVNKVAAAKWAALGVTVEAGSAANSGTGSVAAAGEAGVFVKARALGEVTANGENEVSNSVEVVSDVRVEPIMTTKWDQGDDVYNYYVWRRLDLEGVYNFNQWKCGCGATALAQVMKAFEWPQEETMAQYLQREYTCTVVTNGVTSEVALTLVPGRYEWENMPDEADAKTSDSVKTAIGKLTYNAAVAMRSMFCPDGWATSSTAVGECRALTESFGYAQARLYACGDDGELAAGAGLHDAALRERILYTNLDAGRPVLLSIYTEKGAGHAVVADGYGFEGVMTEEGYENVAYVHLNLGWSGICDLWYNIPEVDVGSYDFVYLEGATFNIAPEEEDAGEIVSGRVRDGNDSIVGGATVNVEAYTEDWKLVGTATTGNGNEIYALTVPEGGTYRLYMSQANGSIVAEQEIVVTNTVQGKLDEYISDSEKVGNLWLGASYVKMQDATVQVGDGKKFRDLSSALGYANRAGLGEVVLTGAAELTRSVTLTGDMKICVADDVDAAKCVVTRTEGATIKVANGAVLTVSDFVVASDATGDAVIEVEDGATLDVQGGTIGIGRVVLGEGARFVTTWTGTDWDFVEGGIALSAGTNNVDGAKVTNWVLVGNGLSADEATEKVTSKILNYAAPRLGGEVQEDGTVAWRMDIAASVNAMAYMVFEGATETNYYATVDELIGDVTNNATIYFKKDCAADFYTLPLVITNEVTICSDMEDGNVKKVCPGADACITIKEGGALTITNVTFTGYRGPRLFSVEGGEMILEKGATLENLASAEATDIYGVTVVNGGAFTMKSGAMIRECYARAGSSKGCYGGGVAVHSGVLNLMGGTIRGCLAYKSTYGNDVYRTANAKVVVSGKVRVDDMYVANVASNPIQVVGELTGSGIGIASSGSSCKAGKVFAVVDAELTEEQLTKTAGKFYCHTVSSLYAVKGEADGATNFVWAAMEKDNSVKPEYALAEVVYEDGTELYYRSVDEALTNLTGAATVIVLGDAKPVTFSMQHTLKYDVVLTATNESAAVILKRATEDARIEVPTGVSLTVTNLTLHGGGTILVNGYPDTEGNTSLLGTEPLLFVDGGALTLEAGTVISNVVGSTTGARSAGAVTVANGGEFTMKSGVSIVNCFNLFRGQKRVDDSEGAAIYVENGVAYLRGGMVTGNWAWRASGVGISSVGARAYVSGDFTVVEDSNEAYHELRWYTVLTNVVRTAYQNSIVTNRMENREYITLDGTSEETITVTTNYTYATKFTYVPASKTDAYCNMGLFGQAQLYLDGELTGTVGITPYDAVQSNVFGKVENWAEWDFETLTNSAAHFKNDVTSAPGVVMTNVNETTALLVWSTVLVNTNLTDSITVTNEAGEAVTYYPLAIPEEAYNLPVPTPEPEPDPEPDPEPSVVEVECQPFKFTAIEEADGGGWTLSLKPGTEYCTYKLYSFTDLADLDNLDNLTPVTTVTLTAADIAADGTFTFAGVYDGTVRYWMVRGENGTKPADAEASGN